MKATSGMMFTIFFVISMLALTLNIQPVKAIGTIYIRADGSVDPPTAPISSFDNVTYALTGNIVSDTDGIVIERNNITLEGAGYTLQGPGGYRGVLSNRSNVTIKNMKIQAFGYGVYLYDSCSNNSIIGNSVTVNMGTGVYLYYTSNNSISGNSVTTNDAEGICLYHSSNNNIVKNNITAKMRAAIFLASSSNNSVVENNVTNGGSGIGLQDSSNNSIAGNNVTNNYYGIGLYSSSNNSVSGNNITANNNHGIYLASSSNNTVVGNMMTGNKYNFGFDGTSLRHFMHSIDASNLVNGKPIHYLVNKTGLSINPATYPQVGYLALINSTNITIEGLTLSHNGQGLLLVNTNNSRIENNNLANNYRSIWLFESQNNNIVENNITANDSGILISRSLSNTISRNNITASSGDGIYIYSSSYNNIVGNRITNGGDGIHLYESSSNTISRNNITANVADAICLVYPTNNNIVENNLTSNGCGIHLVYYSGNNIIGNNITKNNYAMYIAYSSGNSIYHNNFIDNIQIFNYDSSNAWDNGYPSGGNHWSDYNGADVKKGPNQDQPGSDGIGDTQYSKWGITDRYPLMYRWPDNNPPKTTHDYDYLWHTENFIITLNATDDNSGVKETYYRINSGPSIKTVSADGQPLITTEGDNSTLDYWGVDIVGNEESHHILTEIKLDKTAPTGSLMINNNATYTTSTSVTLNLTATDLTSGVYQVRYSNDDIWDTEPWETPSPTKTWTLTPLDGPKTVYYQIKDNAGLVSITYSDIIIFDTAPPTGSITINDGATYCTTTSVTLTLSATDATSGVAEMRFSNDNITWTTWEPYASSKTWMLTTNDETKTVYAQYTDNAGLISSCEDTIILDTTSPMANASTDQIVNEDIQVTFDGSASQDENGIAIYTWAFNDEGAQTLSGKNPAYTFATPGTYTITLRVTDPAGNYATDTIVVTVIDITSPTANAGSDQNVDEDSLITLDGSASSDNVGITTYAWTFSDATTQTLTGEKPTYAFNTPGIYTITLNVTDAAGNWATDTITITVSDITEPVANAGQDQRVDVGATVTFDASGSTDNVGIVSYEWNYGDKTTGTGETSTHTYENPGTYTVTLTVRDVTGNNATHSITVTVILTEAPPPPPAEPFPTWMIAVTLIAIGTAATTLLWSRKQRNHPNQ